MIWTALYAGGAIFILMLLYVWVGRWAMRSRGLDPDHCEETSHHCAGCMHATTCHLYESKPTESQSNKQQPYNPSSHNHNTDR